MMRPVLAEVWPGGRGWARRGRVSQGPPGPATSALMGAFPPLPSLLPGEVRCHLLTVLPPDLGRQEGQRTKPGHANSHLDSDPGQRPRGGPAPLHLTVLTDSPVSRCLGRWPRQAPRCPDACEVLEPVLLLIVGSGCGPTVSWGTRHRQPCSNSPSLTARPPTPQRAQSQLAAKWEIRLWPSGQSLRHILAGWPCHAGPRLCPPLYPSLGGG